VFMQEMDVINTLVAEMVRSLKELQLGFAGELTMSDSMEALQNALFMDEFPGSWKKLAWPSLMGLAIWLTTFAAQIGQIEDWLNNPLELPKVTWVSGLVNPQSFLTAINQVAAQKNMWELDKLTSLTTVKKVFTADEIETASRDGALVSGLNLQGARWNAIEGVLEKSKPKEMFCAMPIVEVKGISVDKAETKNIYSCPTYKTLQRGPTFIFLAQLKTKSAAGRWVLAGVAMIMEV